MFVYDLNDNQYFLNLSKYIPKKENDKNKSKLHLETRALIKKIYPVEIILEEVPLKGTRMFIDLFLPFKLKMFEIQGAQHTLYNNFFYNNKLEFYKSKKRDALKRDWCTKNHIKLIELPYDKRKRWEEIIRGA